MLVLSIFSLILCLFLQWVESSGPTRRVNMVFDDELEGRKLRHSSTKTKMDADHLIQLTENAVDAFDIKALAGLIITHDVSIDDQHIIDQLFLDGHFGAVKKCVKRGLSPSQEAIDSISRSVWLEVVRGLELCPSQDKMQSLASEEHPSGWMVGSFVKICNYVPCRVEEVDAILISLDLPAYKICTEQYNLGPSQEGINEAILTSPTLLSQLPLCPDRPTIKEALDAGNLAFLWAIYNYRPNLLSDDEKLTIENMTKVRVPGPS